MEKNELMTRQLELRRIMKSSDSKAFHFIKTSEAFKAAYPDEAAQYKAAYDEYVANRAAIKELEAKEAEELAAGLEEGAE